MFSLQQLSLCSIPFGKRSKSVYFLHRFEIKKNYCDDCKSWECCCLFKMVIQILKQDFFEEVMWILFHMASSIIVYSSVDLTLLYYNLYCYSEYFFSFDKKFEWDGFSDDILLEHSTCFHIRINDSFDSRILCDIYSRLLFRYRKSMDQFNNCRFYQIYGSILNYLYDVRLLRTQSFEEWHHEC